MIKNEITAQFCLTPEEESQMDLISNAIIDVILSKPIKFSKTPLPYHSKSNSLIVKGNVKK